MLNSELLLHTDKNQLFLGLEIPEKHLHFYFFNLLSYIFRNELAL